MSFQILIEEAVAALQKGPEETVEARFHGMLEGIRIAEKNGPIGCGMEEVREAIHQALLDAFPPITKEDLREIMTGLGESLGDSGGGVYEQELFVFFQEHHAEDCQRWLQSKQDEVEEGRRFYRERGIAVPEDRDEEQEPLHAGLLYAMSSSGKLNSAVIVEFARTNLKARSHLLSLLRTSQDIDEL